MAAFTSPKFLSLLADICLGLPLSARMRFRDDCVRQAADSIDDRFHSVRIKSRRNGISDCAR